MTTKRLLRTGALLTGLPRVSCSISGSPCVYTLVGTIAFSLTSHAMGQSSWKPSGQNTLWGAEYNWVGDVPNAMTDALVGDLSGAEGSLVQVTNDAEVRNLVLTNGSWLTTYNHFFEAHQTIAVNGSWPPQAEEPLFTTLFVVDAPGEAPELIAPLVTLVDGGTLEVRSGAEARVSGSLIGADDISTVLLGGTVNLTGAGTTFNNNGELRTIATGARIDAFDSYVDLDGQNSTGNILVGFVYGSDPADLTIRARGLSDDFSGFLDIRKSSTATFDLDEAWTLGESGTIGLHAQFGDHAATYTGAAVDVEGRITAWGPEGRFEADATVRETSRLAALKNSTLVMLGRTVIEGGEHITEENSEVRFEGEGGVLLQSATFNADPEGGRFRFSTDNLDIAGGADFTGRLIIEQGAEVLSDSVMNAETLELSEGGGATWHVSNDLTINADALGDDANVFRDNLAISRNLLNPATWTVNMSEGDSYTIAGDVAVDAFEFGTTTSIAGSDVEISGDVLVNGLTRFTARVDLTGNEVNLDTGEIVFAGGSSQDANTISDSTFIGGKVSAGSGIAIEGSGVIDSTLAFDSGSSLIALTTDDSNRLELQGGLESLGTLGVRGEKTTLSLPNGYDTAIGDAFVMQGGLVTGSELLNSNHTGIRGFGRIGIAVDNETVISASGGRLVINTALNAEEDSPNTNDLDGPKGIGSLQAIEGSMTIVGESGPFSGSLRIGEDHDVTLEDTAFDFTTSSSFEMFGGRLISDQQQTFRGGMLTEALPAFLEADALIASTSKTTLNSNIILTRDTVIEAGAEFDGAGSLINAETGVLNLLDDAVIGVDLLTEGLLQIGEDSIADVLAIQNGTLSGSVEFDLAGNTAADYDRLAIGETLSVKGVVFDINYAGNFEASLGDEFDLIDFAAFEHFGYTLSLPGLANGLAWDTSDFESLGSLRVVPEPGFVMSLALTGMPLLRRRIRR